MNLSYVISILRYQLDYTLMPLDLRFAASLVNCTMVDGIPLHIGQGSALLLSVTMTSTIEKC